MVGEKGEMKERYFLSFTGECIMNPEYDGYTGGRVEVYDDAGDDTYAVEEIRYFTKNKDFHGFVEYWDFKDVTASQLAIVKKEIKEKYHEIT